MAIDLYEHVLIERREVGDAYGSAVTLRELGQALCASGDIAAGAARLRECLDFFDSEDVNADIARRLLVHYLPDGDESDDR